MVWCSEIGFMGLENQFYQEHHIVKNMGQKVCISRNLQTLVKEKSPKGLQNYKIQNMVFLDIIQHLITSLTLFLSGYPHILVTFTYS